MANIFIFSTKKLSSLTMFGAKRLKMFCMMGASPSPWTAPHLFGLDESWISRFLDVVRLRLVTLHWEVSRISRRQAQGRSERFL